MKIIPVIDLLHGHVVRAERGRRENYRPWRSALCESADPIDLVHALHVDHHFASIYLADLDAIQAQGNHNALLTRINRQYPALEIWLDGGFRTPTDLEAIAQLPRVRGVVGSETWNDRRATPAPDAMLSIDSDEDGPRDPSGICDDPTRRPEHLILMNLRRVGSGQGPDIALLRHWREKAPGAHLYLAGGIRNRKDLVTAHRAGACGVLVATALHNGSLDGLSDSSLT
ncbi:MAG: nickel transporter [Gammaproteobacteria bacterium]|nr:nickel transporter [Gammaproteobacteria bacterium]